MLGLGRRQRCRRHRDLSLEKFQAPFFSGRSLDASGVSGIDPGVARFLQQTAQDTVQEYFGR